MTPEFQKFRPIPRHNRDIVITEKIDGTNAVVYVGEDCVLAGSRSRWITPDDDNFGFARWVQANAEALRGLGDGFHYGEWWGQGIQRGYGLKEKRFSLFNVGRWNAENIPPCCSVVPTLDVCANTTENISRVLAELANTGSIAALGFAKPEGVVIYHTAAGVYSKVTLEKDEMHKFEQKAVKP